MAPFGLLFVLAGERDRATLLLAREERVLRDRPAAEIVEALAGVRIAPATLLVLIAGCPAEACGHHRCHTVSGRDPASGSGIGPDGLGAAESSGARLVAARLGDVMVEYPAAFTGDAPRTDPSAAGTSADPTARRAIWCSPFRKSRRTVRWTRRRSRSTFLPRRSR